MKTRSLKVFGGTGYRYTPENTNPHYQTREIVAATSLTAALRLLKPFKVRRGHCSETGNSIEIATAMSKPGTVFWAPLSHVEKDFRESPKINPGDVVVICAGFVL